MQFEIFAKLPTSTLLFASGRAVVRQVRIRVIVKEAGHYNVWFLFDDRMEMAKEELVSKRAQ
jgi:hypothetical protein